MIYLFIYLCLNILPVSFQCHNYNWIYNYSYKYYIVIVCINKNTYREIIESSNNKYICDLLGNLTNIADICILVHKLWFIRLSDYTVTHQYQNTTLLFSQCIFDYMYIYTSKFFINIFHLQITEMSQPVVKSVTRLRILKSTYQNSKLLTSVYKSIRTM